MWKESYRLGVELIDQQHIALFKLVEDLLKAIDEDNQRGHKEDYAAAITFMKNYVVMHFREEEAYQASIGYSGRAGHAKEHRAFTNTVLEYERQFIETNYALPLVKEFAGTLVSWLIYHVAESDQRIVKGAPEVQSIAVPSRIGSFSRGISQIFQCMFGIQARVSETIGSHVRGDIFTRIEFAGDFKGETVFSFPKEFAFQLMKIMTFMDTSEIDEIVCSAMAEISNIISGNAATDLQGQNCVCDIRPPVTSVGEGRDSEFSDESSVLRIDTEIGSMEFTMVRRPE